MEEKPEQASPSTTEQQQILCQECKINPSKYKCPGCSIRSCSLSCVNSHKKRTACTGKRPLTSFVPISQFDDNLLISDYNMLEDVKRITDSAKRVRVNLYESSQFSLPCSLKFLKQAAARRRTNLKFLPNGMSKRQKNQTYYNDREKFISWTIEWRFHLTDVVLLDHGVNENTTLLSLIQNHLKPGPWNHPLKEFCNETLDSLKFFVKKYPKGTRSPFRQLNIRETIRKQLANMFILEYPVIHVYLPSHSYNFDVIKDATPRKLAIKETPAQHDYSSAKGVIFKEEEIEDMESSAPVVLDLMDHANEREQKKLLPSAPAVEQAECDRSSISHGVTEKNGNIGTKTCIEQLDEIGDLEFDFDFDPDLNVYPDLVDTNLDDVFYFEDGDMEAGKLLSEEELEEGEIA